ncbi:signal-induced proliferation-associated 1-like protein 3 isoform X1 [Synchiropus splendidus]|uniref:signal-induced proliferation-associated 1-like protein 3 isoform X1 n=1 Tax=Synchiropus splendidus TaxID=270530 RepID=UPI00237DC7FB|nr:signal-induced proliferation-associated 1-like protein 3 isoform X1 [Synchiropus splendidus]XP_053729494.1 signal-induced proliferation-associated 1-like protein 3 isoform X1 [Synchiropus splendidus]XP_053729495.1 signal-induced proliferation-associated 1-like protein 3 isoform X1 [Synchiropus splendidus]
MNSYRDRGVTCTSADLLEGGGDATLTQHTPFRHTPNGHPDPTVQPRVSVPKMGVRARIAEWPPRRAQSRESLLENGQSGSNHNEDDCATSISSSVLSSDVGLVRGGVARLPRRRSKEVELRGFGMERGSPLSLRVFPPLRQRSNSEVTLSEQDENEVEVRGGGGMANLFREYGSTSSIDIQGIPDQSFFDMLSQFHQERPDQRSSAPTKLRELLRAPDLPPSVPPPSAPSPGLTLGDERGTARKDGAERVRKKSGGTESSLGTSSLFRKLRSSSRGELDGGKVDTTEDGGSRGSSDVSYKPWICPKSFVHFDAQSILFDLHEAAAPRSYATQRKNTATGASAASVSLSVNKTLSANEPIYSSIEDLTMSLDPGGSISSMGMNSMDVPLGANGTSPLLLCCPHFLNETGGHGERNISFLSTSAEREGGRGWLRKSNASVSVLEVAVDQQVSRLERLKLYSIEHVDHGARYYRDYFHGKEHSNYFGTDDKLGPIAVSIRREKLDDTKDLKDQYQYRLIVRSNELVTLRGSVLEDAVASTGRHGTVRGLPLKEVLEQVVPELNVSCLRLALSTPKVTEQLLKLDEQGLSQKHKVGVLLCRAGQSTEEEMYNNEEASPAFSAFLELLGEQVLLKGFTKYAAQLDTKTDSTGTHSLYTTYQGYEVMFHVSTMLPYMPNNPQQLLRKRHIGNDIVTIIFQEPGALPFTPQNIRSHFQHVFVIVRVHNPCSENTCYSVAVTRMKDVPPFGPPIPSSVTFRDTETFRNFLLAKVINAENSSHKSEKFHTMATRTRQEYLKDLAENYISSTPLDSAGKLNNLISLASKKRERSKAREAAELGAAGAVAWRVLAQDFSGGSTELPCALGLSAEYVLLVDCSTKEVVFNCFCADVIGWTPERLALKIFYGRGDHIAVRVPEGCAQDIREVVQRLKSLTVGCETVDMTLRRNGLGQLGFHVRLDGTVAEVEEYGFAWQAGLRQGSRLVEICKVAAVTLTHEQMIDLLRTSVTVKVVIIPPYEEGGPRRGCTEDYEMKTMEQKPEPEPLAAGYRPSPRPTWRWDSPPIPPGLHSTPNPQRWPQMGPPPPQRSHKTLVPVPYRDPQQFNPKRPVSYPENHYTMSPAGGDRALPYRNPSASFSSPSSGLVPLSNMGPPTINPGPFMRYKPSSDRYGSGQRPLLPYEPHLTVDLASSESSSGFTSQDSTIERCKTEPLWHVPASSTRQSGGGGSQRRMRQDVAGKDSPNRHSKQGDTQYSSHSSSNTLSSNASSSHSDERWFDSGDRGVGDAADPEPDINKGGSNDSGIDAPAHYNNRHVSSNQSHKPGLSSVMYGVAQETSIGRSSSGGETKRRESSPMVSASAHQNKGYRTRTFPPPGSSGEKMDAFKPRAYTPQGYKTPSTEKTRPSRAATTTPTSASLSSSSQKAMYGKTRQTNWQPEDLDSPPSNSYSDSSKKQVDTNSKNVFGQPRLRASLRDLRSPRRTYKSTIEDDLKKLIIMDNPGETPEREPQSPRRTLQRTFSDESLCSSGRKDSSYTITENQSAPMDVLFTCTLPTRRHGSSSHSLGKKVPLSASELSLTEVRDKVPPLRRLDPGLMPLPDTACGLEWSSLVNAAKVYEAQRAVSLFSLTEPSAVGADKRPVVSPVQFPTPQTPRTTPTFSSDEVPNDLSGRLYHLEVMLKQLNTDLEREKQDKVVLLAEMANLRENNQRLQEESQTASEQLRKFNRIFTTLKTDGEPLSLANDAQSQRE